MWIWQTGSSAIVGSDVNLVAGVATYQFGEGTVETSINLRRVGINYFNSFLGNPSGTTFEETNTRQPAAGDWNAGGVFGLQNINGTGHALIYLRSNTLSYCSWRGDYRRLIYEHQDGGLWFEAATGSCLVMDNQEHLGKLPVVRRFRRHRRFGWTYSDCVRYIMKKTGSGAYEMHTTRQLNDGITFLNGQAWALGHVQSDFFDIELFPPAAPPTDVQLTATLSFSASIVRAIFDGGFAATLSFVGSLTKRITDAGFTAVLSFIGNLAPSKKFIRALTATLSFTGTFVKSFVTSRSFTATLFSSGSGGIGTQVNTDNFNRANELPIGGNWTNGTAASDDRMNLVSNVAVPNNVNQDCDCGYNAWASGDDQYSQVEVTTALTDAGAGFGVTVRRSTTAGAKTYYRLVINNSGGFELAKFVLGSITSLRTGSTTYVAGRKLGLSATGSSTTTLKIWYGGVQIGTDVTDSSSPLTTGRPGITFSSGTGFSGSGDNWDAGTAGGGGGPAATLTKRVGKALTATFSPVAAFSKRITHAFTATLSFVGALTKRLNDAGFTATLSFVGNLVSSKTFSRAFTATLSFVGALTKRIIDSGFTATLSFSAALTKKLIDAGFTATLSFIGNLSFTKFLQRAFSGTLSFAGSLSRKTGRGLTATLSFIGDIATNFIHGGGTLFTQSFTATLSFTGAISRRIGKALTATLSFVVATTRAISRGLTATLSFTGLLNASKSLLKSLTATLSFTGNLAVSKSIIKALTATLSFVGNLTRLTPFTRAFTATLSMTGSLSRSTRKTLNATLSFAASLVKRITRTLSGTLSFAGSLVKVIRDAGFTATLSFAGNLATAAVHFFTRSFTATLSFAGSLTTAAAHIFTKSLTATLSFIGALTRARTVFKALTATLSFAGAISRRAGKAFTATLSFSVQVSRLFQKVLRATLSFVASFFTGGQLTLLVGQIAGSTMKAMAAGSSALASKAGSFLQIFKTTSSTDTQTTKSDLDIPKTE